MRRYTVASLLTLMSLLMTGCGGCQGCQGPAPEDEPVVIDEAEPVVEPEGPDPVDLMLESLRRLAEKCEVPARIAITDCEGDELAQHQALIREHGLAVLPALPEALTERDEEIKRAAAFTLREYIEPLLHREDPSQIQERTARRLLVVLGDRSPSADRVLLESVGAAVAIGTAAGVHEQVREFIQKYDPAISNAHMLVRAEALRAAMEYGRMAYVDLVKEAAASDSRRLQRAAFDAVWRMKDWTPEEAQELCGWAVEYLPTEDDEKWRGRQAQLLLRCPDEERWRGRLLEEAERRYAAGTFKRPFSDVIRDVCPRGASELARGAGSMCERARALHIKMAQDPNLESKRRAHAMSTLSQQWPDAQTLALLEGFQDIKDPMLAKRAEITIKRVKRLSGIGREEEEEGAEGAGAEGAEDDPSAGEANP